MDPTTAKGATIRKRRVPWNPLAKGASWIQQKAHASAETGMSKGATHKPARRYLFVLNDTPEHFLEIIPFPIFPCQPMGHLSSDRRGQKERAKVRPRKTNTSHRAERQRALPRKSGFPLP